MFAGETANTTARACALAADFAPEQFARLRALRERYQTTSDGGEFGPDARRPVATYMVLVLDGAYQAAATARADDVAGSMQ